MRDSGEPDWKCGEVAGQFELKGAYLDGPIAKLSGGWQTRVKLAALLLHEPNLPVARRTDELSRPANPDSPGALPAKSSGRGVDRLPRSGVSRGHLRAHARSVPGQIDVLPGQGRCLPGISERNAQHEERSNDSILAKRRHLEDFIARNRARATTAPLAKSKSKQLERLELTEIASDEPTARIPAPRGSSRKGPALRCRDLAIRLPRTADRRRYPSWRSITVRVRQSSGITDREKRRSSERWWTPSSRGQGKSAGDMAAKSESTPSTSTPASRRRSRPFWTISRSRPPFGKKDQEILEVAGSCSFRRAHVRSPSPFCPEESGARLSLAGAVERSQRADSRRTGQPSRRRYGGALAEALLEYPGTVIFTSHDRHFTKRVATCIVEVRDGRVHLQRPV